MGNISNIGWAGKGALLVKTRNMTKMNFLSLYALWHPVNPAQANYKSSSRTREVKNICRYAYFGWGEHSTLEYVTRRASSFKDFYNARIFLGVQVNKLYRGQNGNRTSLSSFIN